jgi:hypothetical protein
MNDSSDAGQTDPTGNIEIEQISDIKDSTLNVAGRDVIHIDQVVIGNQASVGLKALERLLDSSPEVKEVVFASRTRLEEIKGQIDKIADYKDVHDLLHQLQYSCFNMIRREEANFPDLSALEILGSYGMNMETILVRLRAVEARKQIHASELTWIDDVESAHTFLQKAIDFSNPDRGSLVKSTWYLMRIINRFPSLINQSLLREARDLDLPGLLETLQKIAPTAEDTSPDVRSVSEFIDGLNAIQEMNRRLLALTQAHDSWQKLDLEFVQFEEMLETDPSFLEFSWGELILPRLNELLEGGESGEAKNLQAARDALAQEIASQNEARIRNLVNILRRETGIRFFQVDVNLKALCDELRKVAQPLESIIYRITS